MIYTLKGENDIFNPLEQVLKNREIKDIQKFLNPSINDLIPYNALRNMDKAIYLLLRHIRDNSVIGVLVDPDADGISSSASFVSYIKKAFPEIELIFYMHSGKQHGLTTEIVEQIHETQPDLLVIPDAGSNDYEQLEELNKYLDLLILDHHESEKESEHAIVVNNQLSPEYENKSLSGVGIVYKFLKALDDKLELDYADEYLDLVALGNVGDVMRLDVPETRYLVYEGLKNIKNEFLLNLIAKNAKDVKEITPKVLSFKIIPQINAMIRVGDAEQKLDVFRAMVGEQEEFFNTRTKKTETLPQKAARLCTNAYAKQRRVRDKWTEIIKLQIEEQELDKNAFIVLNVDNFDKELSGYIASNLTGIYKKPVLLMSWNEESKSYTGSLRGYETVIRDSKSFLNSLEAFEFVSGHANAAGFSIKKDELEKLPDLINEKMEYTNADSEPTEVDFVLTEKGLTLNLINDIIKYEGLWGFGASEPLFAVKDIEVDVSKIIINKLTGRFMLNGIEFIQFQLNDNLVELAGQNKIATCDFVGKVNVNNWLGKVTSQFIIEAVDIKETKDNDLTFDLFDLFG